jgi:aminopeptidase-like protein
LQYCKAQEFKSHISYLASDSLHGRAPGSIDELKASLFIGHYLKTKCNADVHYQPFKFSVDSLAKDSGINIIGNINRKEKKTLLLFAHYDGLGMGSSKSRELLHKNIIHNGADDNASGVAMVMELGKWFSKQKKLPYNVLLVFTSAHEAGLFGAEYFAETINNDSLKIFSIMDFDMVGRLDNISKTLRVGGVSSDSLFLAFFKSKEGNPIHFRFDDSNINFSDLKYFKKLSVPMLHFTTGITEDYHKSTDDTNTINFKGMNLIFSTVKELINECFF